MSSNEFKARREPKESDKMRPSKRPPQRFSEISAYKNFRTPELSTIPPKPPEPNTLTLRSSPGPRKLKISQGGYQEEGSDNLSPSLSRLRERTKEKKETLFSSEPHFPPPKMNSNFSHFESAYDYSVGNNNFEDFLEMEDRIINKMPVSSSFSLIV